MDSTSNQIQFEQGQKSVYFSIIAGWILRIISDLFSPWINTFIPWIEESTLSIIITTFFIILLYFFIFIFRIFTKPGYIVSRSPIKQVVYIITGLLLTILLYPRTDAITTIIQYKKFSFYLYWVLFTFLTFHIRAYFNNNKHLNEQLNLIAKLRYEKEISEKKSELFSKYVEQTLYAIKLYYDAIFDDETQSKLERISEKGFISDWEPIIEKALGLCCKLKSIDETEESYVWATVYYLEDDIFKRNVSWISDSIPNDIKQQINSDKEKSGILTWVLKEFEKETLQRNAKMPWKGFPDVVLRELPETSPNENKIPARSTIGLRLEYHGKLIGVLIVASMTKGYFKPRNVFPIIIMSRILIFLYAHHYEFCPWHRKGWRNIQDKNKMHTQSHRFVFIPEMYNPIKVSGMIETTGLIGFTKDEFRNKITNEYIDRFKKIYVNRNNIASVFLRGSFNGWKPDHLKMNPTNGSGNTWELELNLPNGWYSYGFSIHFHDGNIEEEDIFDPINGNKIKSIHNNDEIIDTQIYIQ